MYVPRPTTPTPNRQRPARRGALLAALALLVGSATLADDRRPPEGFTRYVNFVADGEFVPGSAHPSVPG